MKPWERYQSAEAGPWQNYQQPEEQAPEGGNIANPVAQGLSFGFADEIGGLVGAVGSYLDRRTGTQSAFEGRSFGERYTNVRDDIRNQDAAFRERNPKTALAAELGGGLLTGGVGAAKAGVASAAELARVGGGLGGVAGIGYSDDDDFADDAAIGIGVGAVAGSALPAVGQQMGKLRQRMTQGAAPSPEYARAVQVLQDADVPLTSGQQTASNWQKALETQLAQQPMGGAPMQRALEDQRRVFQGGLLSRVGMEGEQAITPETMSGALRGISGQYDDALSGLTLNMRDPKLVEDVSLVRDAFDGLPKSLRKPKVEGWIDDIVEEIGAGQISGERYQLLRSNLGDAAKSAKRSEHKRIYKALQGSLDQAVERSMPDVMGPINAQYAQAKTLQQVAQNNGGAEAAEGLLPIASLNRAARKSGAPQEFKDYVNAGATVLPDRVPNSGTAQRAAMQGLLQGGGGGVVGTAFGGPVGGILGAAGPAVVTNALSRQLANKRIDVTRLLPSGRRLNSPLGASPVGASGLLSQHLQQ